MKFICFKKFVCGLFFTFSLSASAFELNAQTIDATAPLKKGKALVSVPVAVSDREGHYIFGLKKQDFTVYQDGVKQEIVSFETENEPVSVALLIDTSQSAQKVLGKIKNTSKDFIKLLNPNDQCMLATFDSQVNILSQFTSNRESLEKAVDTLKIGEKVGTVMRRAVSQIVGSSFAPVKGRKAIILLTDGKDFGSYMTKPELLELLQESDVMVYTVFYKTGLDFNKLGINSDGTLREMPVSTKPPKKIKRRKKDGYSLSIPEQDFPSDDEIKLRERRADAEAIDALKKMSDTTAGRFYLRDVTDLGKTLEEIAGELRRQYRIAYYSNADADDLQVYDIKVKVERPDAVVRTREGFRARQAKR